MESSKPESTHLFVGGPLRVKVLGMPLERWQCGACIAEFGVGDDWATLYSISSANEGRGHATALINAARDHYQAAGKRFGSSVALNDRMSRVLRRLGVFEYHGTNVARIDAGENPTILAAVEYARAAQLANLTIWALADPRNGGCADGK